MGIKLFQKQVSPDLLSQMLHDPLLVEKVIQAEPHLYEQLLIDQGCDVSTPDDLLKYLSPFSEEYVRRIYRCREELSRNPAYTSVNIAALSLDKACAALRFILRDGKEARAEAADRAVFGGRAFQPGANDASDVTRYEDAAGVRQISDWLSGQKLHALQTHSSDRQLGGKDLYGFDNAEKDVEWVLSRYKKMVEYVHDAVRNGNAMIYYLK